MDKAGILHIIKQSESESLEFKTSFGKEVIECIVAFSNTRGGKVIVGVNNDKNIAGITVSDETIQNWLNQIKQNTQPQVIPEVQTIEVSNGHMVVFDVMEYPIKPVAYRNKYIITGDPQRTERFDYPPDAIREIVVNKLIARAFKEIGLIERYGSGIMRVRRICKEHGINEPKFEEAGNGFMVTLFKKKSHVTDNDTDNDTERAQIVINLIRKDSKITINQIAKKLLVSRSTILRDINKLKANGQLRRVGSEKGGLWEICLKT